MDKPKKQKRRTLAIIDGESLSPQNHYDFSFLEREKRLDIWFFFKNKIQHSFTLHKDYNAKSIVLPRYEEDTLSYIIKRVCYELGRRGEKYHKIYFIGDVHPQWENLVQFFRERGYVAHHFWSEDYAAHDAKSFQQTPSTLLSEKSDASSSQISPSKVKKNPLSSDLYEKLQAHLRKKLAGKTISRKEFVQVLHKLGISIRKHVHRRDLNNLIRYLSAQGLATYNPDTKEVVILPHELEKS